MLRVRAAVVLMILLAGLLAADCDQGAGEETTVPSTLPAPPITAASPTTTTGATTAVPTTIVPATTPTVRPIESLWASPLSSLVAVSAEEAWAFSSGYYQGGDDWSGVAHFVDGAWDWVDVAGFDADFRQALLSVFDIEVGPDGVVWFATESGLVSFDDGLGSYDDITWVLDYVSVSEIEVGPNGVVWFATEDGLSSFDGTEWANHLQGQTVTAVDVAPDGTVWYVDEEGPHILGN